AAGVGAPAAGVDLLDQYGAGCRAVALPQLLPVRAIAGRKEQRAVHVREPEQAGVVGRAGAAGVDVLDQDGPGGAAVALPQLPPLRAVVGRSVQGAVAVREAGGVGGRAAVDVLDQDGAGGGAVALPQLRPVRAIVGRKEQRAVHIRQVTGAVDGLDRDGAGG